MLDQHPVFIALAAERRRELLDNEPFAALDEAAQCELLDGVKRVRELLDYKDQSDRFNDPGRRDEDACALARSLAADLKIIDPGKPNGRPSEISRIRADLINGLTDFHQGSISEAIHELQAFSVTARRMQEVIKGIQRAPPQDDLQQRTRRTKREALELHWLLTDAGVEVKMTTPGAGADRGLALLGLLADPPATAEAMRKRLRR
jgi:hypothetical protein